MPKKNELKWLTSGHKKYPSKPDAKILETFENRHKNRSYDITFDCPEFTSICPITGQPDFAHIIISYVPSKRCIESKSLKLYLYSYRNTGIFFEEAVNQILDHLLKACQPTRMHVSGQFNVRGGVGIKVDARYSSRED